MCQAWSGVSAKPKTNEIQCKSMAIGGFDSQRTQPAKSFCKMVHSRFNFALTDAKRGQIVSAKPKTKEIQWKSMAIGCAAMNCKQNPCQSMKINDSQSPNQGNQGMEDAKRGQSASAKPKTKEIQWNT